MLTHSQSVDCWWAELRCVSVAAGVSVCLWYVDYEKGQPGGGILIELETPSKVIISDTK